MTVFFMFGKYSPGAAQKISAERTRKARELIQSLGGQVKGIYAMLGEFDVVVITEFPRMGEAMQASVALKSLTDISFFTVAAMPIEDFDKLFESSESR
jgi:uncharacterized protein with GYD domain